MVVCGTGLVKEHQLVVCSVAERVRTATGDMYKILQSSAINENAPFGLFSRLDCMLAVCE